MQCVSHLLGGAIPDKLLFVPDELQTGEVTLGWEGKLVMAGVNQAIGQYAASALVPKTLPSQEDLQLDASPLERCDRISLVGGFDVLGRN